MKTLARLQLPSQTVTTAAPRAAELLTESKAKMGMIPNMYANMANSPGLFDTYAFGYNQFRANSGFTPVEQEVVFLTISRDNGCGYCMAAHSFIADTASAVPTDVTDAIRDGRPVPDAKLDALARFTTTMFATRGRPSQDDVEAFVASGYSERAVLEIILAISVKTLSNYSNHVFGTDVDAAFAKRTWRGAPAEAR
ncbi:MAG: carboxymuconolactone decarboxylase family protein [Vulcanimicrobiaceae bacterium]